MKQTVYKKLSNSGLMRHPASKLAALLIIGGIAYLGVSTLTGSHAATPTNTFVTRSGAQLMSDGKVFRFGGVNMYWVGLDDNIRDGNGNPTYPTHYRIDNAFDGAAALGAGVARTHTVGISVGCSQCLEPSPGTFNDTAFESIDYAVAAAGKRNIKLMVPLIDQWRYYHGGKWNFVHWAYQVGVPGVVDTSSDLSKNAGNSSGPGSEKEAEAQFYTNPQIMTYYKAYLNHLLNHVNQYTGVALKNDPTIMAWETGNEIFDAPVAWTTQMATYLKTTIGVKQLVADGSAAGGNHVSNAALDAPNIDIVGGHFYDYPNGLDTGWMNTDAALAASKNKAYVVGEYAWTRSERPAFLSAIEGNVNVAGDMLWALLPRKEDGSLEQHGSTSYGSDDVSLYVPGSDSTMNGIVSTLTSHFSTMAGVLPAAPPKVSLAAPTNGASVTGPSVTVTAAVTAGDNTVAVVGFFLDGSTTALKSDAVAPYSFNWDSTSVANGSHTFQAVVTDSKGLQGSSSVTFMVAGSNLTTLNDTSTGTGLNQLNYVGGWQPSNGAGKYQSDDHYSTAGGDYATIQFSGTQIKYWYSQAPHHGITGVSIDGAAETNVDLYSANRTDGTAFWASPVLAKGTHTLKIRNTGNRNASSTSTVVNIDRIDVLTTAPTGGGGDTTAPTVSVSANPTSVTVGATVAISAAASDNVAVTKVEIYDGASLKATDTAAPYTYTYETTGASTGVHPFTAKAYDAAGNVATSSGANVTIKAAVPVNTPGDVNGDGRVNALDLSVVLSHDGQNYPPADFNKDGTVGAADLAILLGKWTW